MNTHKLGKLIARGIFQVGNEVFPSRKDKTQRIAFKGGEWPDNETDLGGLDEWSLASHIERLLNQHLPDDSEASAGEKP